ncbi:unnamed protein product [Acanthoscelides obtectus]|uniref:Uncharacterized protein n=1 Tax=Acanthoscelides obtectus TaxID=200917 RepID=A0A9P0LV60_ACAOB|nr:unnamed protein product [Acanthoscelides obtectus]CAK1656266.1 hypothetical protein AOBTE_LOCUS19635 [Acanthoscelides obtectus]
MRSMINRCSWIFGNNSNIVFRPACTSMPRGFDDGDGSSLLEFSHQIPNCPLTRPILSAKKFT